MPSSFSFFFFFKQKTAYEMRISDWSSDVCSSDLTPASQAFVADFQKKHGKPPENHAWIEYIALKLLARAMEETKSTDTEKLVDFFEKGAKFDILKARSEEHTSELQSLMRISYAVFCLKKKKLHMTDIN